MVNPGGSSDAEPQASGALFIGVGRMADLGVMSNVGLTRFGGLAAVWRDPPDAADARRIHHDLVAACCRRGPFLPSRFGLVAAHGDHFLLLLERHADRLRDALAAVDGYVEISVEVGAGEDVRVTPTSKAIERLEAIAQAIRVEAGLKDSQSRAFISAEASPRLTMALLAPSVAAFTIADRLERSLRQFSADHAAKVSGPWPPYHFSELGGFASITPAR
ncbi:MAG: GvpL/GvpF family gas vesicle protein [Beijerinckiaceae bacterium]|nr:GvpL/GvpF family gas vesicle protein [Beijerinckiaceae bacterium]